MLLNLGRQDRSDLQGWSVRGVTILLGAGLAVELLAFRNAMPPDFRLPAGTLTQMQEAQGAVTLVRPAAVPHVPGAVRDHIRAAPRGGGGAQSCSPSGRF